MLHETKFGARFSVLDFFHRGIVIILYRSVVTIYYIHIVKLTTEQAEDAFSQLNLLLFGIIIYMYVEHS